MSPVAAHLPLVLAGAPAAAAHAPAAETGAPRAATCTARYADTLTALGAAAREREARPSADYVHCLRATAVYEHLSYGHGGKLRRQYFTKVRHGTGFVYRARGGESLVATNQHVVSFPEVTGDGAELEGVPPGSRRVRAEVRIVVSEAEPEDAGQPVLSRVVEDESLDLAVLAAQGRLPALPYRVGRSRDVRVGDAVLVRGFPLGAFAALNAGRVIGTGQRDVERGWDHEDFAIDALLNLGSSGSPVLAVSCEPGDPELVGIYHAGYRGAQGLNVVLGLVRRYRRAEAAEGRGAATARERLAARIRDREEDQADLLAALRVGADDLVTVTNGEWSAASSRTADRMDRRAGSGKELVLPTR